jgi:hypothetical protein
MSDRMWGSFNFSKAQIAFGVAVGVVGKRFFFVWFFPFPFAWCSCGCEGAHFGRDKRSMIKLIVRFGTSWPCAVAEPLNSVGIVVVLRECENNGKLQHAHFDRNMTSVFFIC